MLRPLVLLPQDDPALTPPAFTPIEAVFPEKDCDATLVTVAEASDDLAVAAQSAYEVVARGWPSGPVPASWTLVLDELSRTEATLTLGPPTHVCLDADEGNTVFAPMHVETADGRVDHTTDIAWRLDAAGNVTSDMRATWVPVADFERVIGVRGMDFEAARYATASVRNTIAPASDVFSGAMFCSSSDPYVHGPYILPVLRWCSGTGCSEDSLGG